MKKILSLFIFVTIINQVQAQVYSWAKNYGNLGSFSGKDMVIDDLDNIYTVGSFSDEINFSDNPNNSLLSKGNHDIYINKLNKLGEHLWSLRIGGKNSDQAKRILYDSQDNLIIGGSFGGGEIDFDPRINEYILENDLTNDQFILKLSSNGEFIWINHIRDGEISDLVFDEKGNIYAIGQFQNEITFEINGELQTKSATNLRDSYIQKIDPQGKTLWVKTLSGNGNEMVKTIKVDSEGNIYCAGVFEETTDFDPSSEDFLLQSKGNYDLFLLKMNSEGEFLWANSKGSPKNDLSPLIEIRSDNQIYFIGKLNRDISMNLIDATGSEVWSKIIPRIANSDYVDIDHILVDENNYFFLAGDIIGNIDFDPSDELTILSTNTSMDGESNCFVAQYNNDGALVWVNQIIGDQYEGCRSMDLDSNKDLILLGYFASTIEINSEGFSFFAEAQSYRNDIFLAKILNNISAKSEELNTSK